MGCQMETSQHMSHSAEKWWNRGKSGEIELTEGNGNVKLENHAAGKCSKEEGSLSVLGWEPAGMQQKLQLQHFVLHIPKLNMGKHRPWLGSYSRGNVSYSWVTHLPTPGNNCRLQVTTTASFNAFARGETRNNSQPDSLQRPQWPPAALPTSVVL